MTTDFETDTPIHDASKTVTEKAEEGAAYAGQKVESAAASVGGALKSMGDSVRHNGPHDGVAGSVSSSMAGTLESTGEYLQTHGLGDAAEDLTNVIRRHPVPSLFVAMGVGFLLAQATHRSTR